MRQRSIKRLTLDEARRMALNFAKLPEPLQALFSLKSSRAFTLGSFAPREIGPTG